MHRIGQTRTVRATKLLVRGTVEERVVALAERKEARVQAALGKETGGSLEECAPSNGALYIMMHHLMVRCI